MSAKIFGNLAGIITEIVREKVRAGVSQIADEITEEARVSMEDFYGDYEPRMYKHRQGGIKDTFTRYYRNPHNTVYHGGVELHPGSGSYYGRTNGKRVSVGADWVSALAIFNGMHGNAEAFPYPVFVPPRMNPTPWERITKKRDEIRDHIQDYFN